MAIKRINRSAFMERSFRSAEEVLRYIDKLKQETDELCRVARQQIRLLSSVTLDIAGDGPRYNSPVGKAGAPEKIVVEDMEKFRSNYSVAAEMQERLEELNVIQAELEMKFGDNSSARMGSTVMKATAQLQLIRTKLQQELREVLDTLQHLAHAKVPESFKKFTQGLYDAVSKGLNYEDVQQQLFIHEHEGAITFSYYLKLINPRDLNDKLWTHGLYIVTSAVFRQKSTDRYVTVLQQFAPPGRFLLGRPISSGKQALEIISQLLERDNFANSLGRLPLENILDTKRIGTDSFRKQFKHADQITKLTIDEDSLVFHLSKSVTDEAVVQQIQKQLHVELQGLKARTNVNVRSTIVNEKPRKIAVTFTRGGGEAAVTVNDIRFLGDRFGVTPGTLKKVVDVLNGDNGRI